MYDLLFKNARLIDGSGASWQRGDLAVKDGRIAAVGGVISASANEVIDAESLVLTPGFIDIHSHSDSSLANAREAESRILQGVTTELAGNCGGSPNIKKGYTETNDHAWTRLSAYFKDLAEGGISVNFATLVGHGTLRAAAMGYEQRPATTAEIVTMQNLADEAMQDGAFGMSSGLIYPPSSYADVNELTEVAKALTAYHGIYESHVRHENEHMLASLKEAAAVGIGAGIPVQIAHLKVTGRKNWQVTMPSVLAYIEKQRRLGLDITMDQYPYTASSTSLSTLIPQWAHNGGNEAMLSRLADPDQRNRIRQEILDANAHEERLWSDYLISRLPSGNYNHLEGKTLEEIGTILCKDPIDAALDLILEEKVRIGRIFFGMAEDDVELVMSHPLTMIGSDGSAQSLNAPGVPHPRSFATFTRVLGHYCRTRQLFSLETAVKKMTGLPAWRMRLADRGLLRQGFKADLVLFDADTISDVPSYANPKQASAGIERVYVNGVLTAFQGKHTGARAGQIILRT